MPGFNRPKLRAISAVFPQLDNDTWITPRRGIAGILRNAQFGVGSAFWTLTGNADIKQGRCTLGNSSQVEQVAQGVADGEKVVIQITVSDITGTIEVDYDGLNVGPITTVGTTDFSVTIGGTNLLEVIAGVADDCIIESIFARLTV